jgi:hypothetical protein
MEIHEDNTLENSGKQNPKMGFKPPRAQQQPCHLLIDFPTVFKRSISDVKIAIPRGNEQEGFKALSRQGVIGRHL